MAENPEPDVEATIRFFEDFKQGSDRAMVIVAAAQADDALREMIERLMRPTLSDQDELFDGDAPLATFSARIRVAYRLGLIDDRLVRALNILRRIRNGFAHDTTATTLEQPPHSHRVRELMNLFTQEKKFAEIRASVGGALVPGRRTASRSGFRPAHRDG
jgi:DNA-binding MltR family transcriptional regulator